MPIAISGLTRRSWLHATGALAVTAVCHRATADAWATQAPASAAAKAGTDALNARRADLAKAPIVRTRLTDRLELLAGPGGNVVVLHGPDGRLLVDTFVKPAWPALPAVTLADTHALRANGEAITLRHADDRR